jgi:tetratricopeptide (TPR) repeat protein
MRRTIWGTYFVLLTIFLMAAFFSDHRIWGVNWWGYYSWIVPVLLYLLGLGLGLVILRLPFERLNSDDEAITPRNYRWITLGIGAGLTAAFVLLRTKVHFLGDGYTLLSLLASQNPLIKLRNLGGMYPQIKLAQFLGEPTETDVLWSYRIVSVVMGAIFVVMTVFIANRLFENRLRRILFLLGIFSGGYMLHFFGYVENYALFYTAVAAFCLIGIAALKGLCGRWWLLVPFAIASISHIFGLILFPALSYVIVRDMSAGKWLSDRRDVTWLSVVSVVVAAGTAYVLLSRSSYFVRFAVLPVLKDRFTLEGYTMFSLPHLVDFTNLLLLLLPGIALLLLAAVWIHRRQKTWSAPELFLLIAAIPCLGLAFVVDPKLGMPRDWDLLAFAGIPLAFLLYYSLLERRSTGESLRAIALSVVLGFLILGPRTVVQSQPPIAIDHLRNYLALDVKKGYAAHYILAKYYEDHGDTASAQRETDRWKVDFPERDLVSQGQEALRSDDYAVAVAKGKQAIRFNPVFADAYSVAGAGYLALNMLDSAEFYLNISIGLNPYNKIKLFRMGMAQMGLGKPKVAKKYFDDALELDENLAEGHYALGRVELMEGNVERSYDHVKRLDSLKNVPLGYFMDLLQDYVGMDQMEKARYILDAAVRHGLDSAAVRQILSQVPQLTEGG